MPRKISNQDIYENLKDYFSQKVSDLMESDDRDFTLQVNIDSLHRLIEYVDVFGSSINGTDSLIYRGVSNQDYGLVPSIMRNDIFANGKPSKDEVDRLEKKLITEFKKQARPYLSRLPREEKWEWEWLALAQHHFLPTRLLDWTERAGTALFFAVEKKENIERENKDGCVWAIMAPIEVIEDRNNHPKMVDGVRLYRPPHIEPRITMQQGCFTVHPGNYMTGVMQWIKGPKIKFIIKQQNKERIRSSLYTAGVNRASLFPDLDGLAKHLRETVSNYLMKET